MAHGIKVFTEGGRLCVASPYHPEFVSEAKWLRGRWNPARSAWCFDPRDGDAVRRILWKTYGTDGTPVETVDVRVHMSDFADDKVAVGLGRVIAERRCKKCRVRLGDGVVLVEGHFRGAGGSYRHPALGPNDAVVEIRDVPVALIPEDDEAVEIVRRHPAPTPETPETEEAEEAETVETLLARLMEATGEGTPEAALRAALRIITTEEA